ncbi:hypothetical protein KM043_004881 [Ampulex compressa]|nr:hypothetical protein KM043_004881 [Ampulex compressa]
MIEPRNASFAIPLFGKSGNQRVQRSEEPYGSMAMEGAIATMSSVLSNGTYLEAIESFSMANDTFQEGASRSIDGRFFPKDTRRDSLYIVIPVTVIYASIFVTGLIGNVSTCIVIARNKSMHTATNYYLFSLAISDLLLLVSGLPPEIYLVWYKYSYIFGEGFCVLRGLAAETSTNASVLTITAFTVERYVAICHPFLSQTMSKLSRAVKLILVVWLVALSFALPQALQFGVVRHGRDANVVVACTLKRILLRHSFELSTFLFFVVPMSLITVLYALIGLKLRKSNMMKRNSGSSGSDCRHHHAGRSSRRVLKMLVAVVIAFFTCWAPFHVQRLVAIYGTNTEDHITSNSKWMEFLYLLMTYISGVLYYVSTTINPILYNIMSNKFRVAFMETLSRSCRVPGLAARTEQRSYSSLSRSQQKTTGAYGSRVLGTAGTGVAHESTECSGNSGKEERKAFRELEEPLENRVEIDEATDEATRSGDTARLESSVVETFRKEGSRRESRIWGNGRGRDGDRSSENLDGSWRKSRARGCTEVGASKANASEKKWWRIPVVGKRGYDGDGGRSREGLDENIRKSRTRRCADIDASRSYYSDDKRWRVSIVRQGCKSEGKKAMREARSTANGHRRNGDPGGDSLKSWRTTVMNNAMEKEKDDSARESPSVSDGRPKEADYADRNRGGDRRKSRFSAGTISNVDDSDQKSGRTPVATDTIRSESNDPRECVQPTNGGHSEDGDNSRKNPKDGEEISRTRKYTDINASNLNAFNERSWRSSVDHGITGGQIDDPTRNFGPTHGGRPEDGDPSDRNPEEDRENSRRTRYAAVKISSVEGSERKWWRILRWLPGLKVLRLPRRTTYCVSENRVLEEPLDRMEELSLAMWNVRETNGQRPI